MKKSNSFKMHVWLFILFFFAGIFNGFSQEKDNSWVPPPSAEAVVNPYKDSIQLLPHAQKIYLSNCSPCHGKNGKGDGPQAVTCTPSPADHTSDKVQNQSDGSMFWKIARGHTPMVSFKKTVTEAERWELVLYIRSLVKKQ